MSAMQVDKPEADDQPETSRAGLYRMQRLAASRATCNPSPRSAIHPITSQLIYPTPSSSGLSGCLVTNIFKPSIPRPLVTPNIFSPPRDISISHDGEWIIIFHPNPLPNNPTTSNIASTVDTGGTLAIYPRTILDVFSTPNTIAAKATFNLPTAPISIVHLYPDTPHPGASYKGPRKPKNIPTNAGPTFLVLANDGILLFHPNRLGDGSFGMNVLRCPIHVRWSALMSGSLPPDLLVEEKIYHGWMDVVNGDEGVWVGWESKGIVRVTRLEIKGDQSGYVVNSIPMPALPIPPCPDWQSGESTISVLMSTDLQGIVFTSDTASQETSVANGDINGHMEVEEDKTDDNKRLKRSKVKGIAAILIYRDTCIMDGRQQIRSRMEVISFQRSLLELAESFSELGGDTTHQKAWDWMTSPSTISSATSPIGTTIVALHALSNINTKSSGPLALAILNQPTGPILTRLKLLSDSSSSKLTSPEPENTWDAITGNSTPLGDLNIIGLQLVISQSANRGLLGLVGVINPINGLLLMVSPQLDTAHTGSDSLGEEAAEAFVAAIKQETPYSDVVRAVMGLVPRSKQSDLVRDILKQFHGIVAKDATVSLLHELLRLQVALYSASGNTVKTETAAELVHLLEARDIFTTCHERSNPGGTASFQIESIWLLISVSEWIIGVLERVLKEAITAIGRLEWDDSDDISSDSTPTLIYLVHPRLRRLIIELLARIRVFSIFVLSLDQPILQPETRYAPMANTPDLRATIIAKDKIKDLQVRWGVDIETWGKALASMNIKVGITQMELDSALVDLDIQPIAALVKPTLLALPTPSALFLADTGVDGLEAFDGVTFQPLRQSSTPIRNSQGQSQGHRNKDGRDGLATCDRCAWQTSIFRDKVFSQAQMNGQLGGVGGGIMGMMEMQVQVQMQMQISNLISSSSSNNGVRGWKKEGELGCVCGGTWVV